MKLTRLKTGNSAPTFKVKDTQGNTIDLALNRERITLLSFFRYASCPLCNLRVRELIRSYDQLTSRGIDIIAVFQSTDEQISRYVGEQHPPFPIIADPEAKLYQMYRVESSWRGFLRTWTLGISQVIEAVVGNRFFPGRIDGEINRIPADFLIDTKGMLIEAYYGNDIGDHIPVDQLIKTTR